MEATGPTLSVRNHIYEGSRPAELKGKGIRNEVEG
jgi:hypothetical protein